MVIISNLVIIQIYFMYNFVIGLNNNLVVLVYLMIMVKYIINFMFMVGF